MCGICGIVFADPERRVPEPRLWRMREALVHRGPDDAGTFIEENVGLAHRRLSILDLSVRGHQPMESKSKRFCITYNGEIYNYRALRDELSSQGHRFFSDSDTEVLVEGLEEWGLLSLLSRLDGIFAFAAWDRLEQRLLAARDHFGVKPFYFSETPEEIVFASEIKSLWVAGVPREVDLNKLGELLVFRFVAGQDTPFHGVRRLLPGHYLQFCGGRLTVRPYWKPIDHVGSDPAYIEIWKRRFSQAIDDQRVSHVSLGTFLSGGLDSSTVTADVARASTKPVQTFTISVPSTEGYDEWPYAAAVAKRWNCQSHVLRVPADDVLKRLRLAQSCHDEPLAFGNDMHIFELSRMAKRYVTVLLSGEGADETLGGYTRYEPVRHPTAVKLAISPIGAPFRGLLGVSRSRELASLQKLLSVCSFEHVMLYNYARVLPYDLKKIGFHTNQRFEVRRALIDEAARVTAEPAKQLMLYDIQTYLCSILDRNDRMTMAASIECRVPFLAIGVVEAALKLPLSALFSGRFGKYILRKYAADLLPEQVLKRPKWGLGIPWDRYLRNDPLCIEFVSDLPSTELARALDAPGLRTAIRAFLDGDDRQGALVYQIFALAIWWEQVVQCEVKPWSMNANGNEMSSLP